MSARGLAVTSDERSRRHISETFSDALSVELRWLSRHTQRFYEIAADSFIARRRPGHPHGFADGQRWKGGGCWNVFKCSPGLERILPVW